MIQIRFRALVCRLQDHHPRERADLDHCVHTQLKDVSGQDEDIHVSSFES